MQKSSRSFFFQLGIRQHRAAFSVALILLALNCRSATENIAPVSEENDKELKEIFKPSGEKESIPNPDIATTTRDKKGKPIRTFFSGAELIREKALVDGFQTTRISIRSATIRHENVIIQTPLLVLEAEGARGRMEGGVRIHDPASNVTILAGRALYERLEQKVFLQGNPHLISQSRESGTIVVSTTQMERDLALGISFFKNDVRIASKDFMILADEGRLVDAEKKLYVSEHPLILGPGQYMSGNGLEYALEEKRLSLLDDIVQLSYKKEKSYKEKKSDSFSLEEFARNGAKPPASYEEAHSRETNVLTAKRMDYRPSDQDNRPLVEVHGDVSMVQESLYIKTEYVMAGGENFNEIYTSEKVNMLDKKQNINVIAGEMHFDRNRQKLRLEKEPVIEFLKKGTDEVTAQLSGELIERSFLEGKTLARGRVKIERENSTLEGEQATFFENEDVLLMEGNPSFRQGGSRIFCEKIIMYPGRGRVLLQNRIQGFISN